MFLKDLIGIDNLLPKNKTWKEFVFDIKDTLNEKEDYHFQDKMLMLMQKYSNVLRYVWTYCMVDTDTDYYNRLYLQLGVLLFLQENGYIKGNISKKLTELTRHVDNWLCYRQEQKFHFKHSIVTPQKIWSDAINKKRTPKCIAKEYHLIILDKLKEVTDLMYEAK